MKTQKIYIATGNRHRLNIEVKIKGKWQRVDFSNGGISINGNARFQTSDPDIQKALESSKMFGDMFKLQSQRQLEEPSKKAPTEQDMQGGKEAENQGAENQEVDNGKDSEEGGVMTFPNYNSLRDYLVSEHGCKPAEVRSLNDALDTAGKLNLNVAVE